MPSQTGQAESVEISPNGEMQIHKFSVDNPSLKPTAWVHSHHSMTLVPSRSDAKTQFCWQKQFPHFVMIIKNNPDGMKGFRLTPDAMRMLEPQGEVAEGIDVMSLVEDVP